MAMTSSSCCPVPDFCTDWFLCRIDHYRSPSGSLSPSKPSAVLLQGPHELVCLVYGFRPASINITWLLDNNTQLQSYNTSEPHKGSKGKFSVQSLLPLSPAEWLPGEIYTCRVTHSTISIALNISKPGLFTITRFDVSLEHLIGNIFNILIWRWTPAIYSWSHSLLLNRPCGGFWVWTHLCFHEKCLSQVNFLYGEKRMVISDRI